MARLKGNILSRTCFGGEHAEGLCGPHNNLPQPFLVLAISALRHTPLVLHTVCVAQMAPTRVGTSLRSLSNKRARIGNICRGLEEKEREIEERERVEHDVVDIVQALLDDPQKIPGCRRAVMSNQFAGGGSCKGFLHDTIIKLDRVPDFWKQEVLSQLGKEWAPENLKDKKTNCKGYVEKALYRSSALRRKTRCRAGKNMTSCCISRSG